MRFPRSAGVLLHPTSFPGRYGIGDLGEAAYQFVHFLANSKQTLWQVLPLGPTSYGDSPYQSFSSFAGNPLLINPDWLVQAGYLPAAAIKSVPPFPANKVDFGPVIEYKNQLLDKAYDHFLAHSTAEQQAAYQQFTAANSLWLEDFALFMALKNHHQDQDGGVWNKWPAEIARRQPQAIAEWSKKLSRQLDRHRFAQFLFDQQWQELKSFANSLDIKIVGDAPIFVAFDSADVWANQSQFYLEEDGSPSFVAGVPPDYFSETGQRWGNPLYKWDEMAKDNYTWWASRLRQLFTQVDMVRIDHFRGFAGYWEIPATEPTAVIGRWVPGPGIPFFQSIQDQLGQLPIIAEDLGVITPEVEELRDTFDFPGMKILQFGFGGEQNSDFLPHNFTPNCVVYTGTHDNETTVGWYLNASPAEQDHVRRYLARDGRDIAWDLLRLAHTSVADTAIIPLQDLFSLGNEARMNLPGRPSGNWQWRYTPSLLTDQIILRLREITQLYGRAKEEEEE